MLIIETKELEISDKLKSLDDLDESRKNILEEMRMSSNYDDKEIGRTIQ